MPGRTQRQRSRSGKSQRGGEESPLSQPCETLFGGERCSLHLPVCPRSLPRFGRHPWDFTTASCSACACLFTPCVPQDATDETRQRARGAGESVDSEASERLKERDVIERHDWIRAGGMPIRITLPLPLLVEAIRTEFSECSGFPPRARGQDVIALAPRRSLFLTRHTRSVILSSLSPGGGSQRTSVLDDPRRSGLK